MLNYLKYLHCQVLKDQELELDVIPPPKVPAVLVFISEFWMIIEL